MTKLTKRAKAIQEAVTAGKSYSLNEAVELFKSLPKTKFNQSVDLAVNLGVDPRKSDQAVRGSVVLPKGTGKSVRIAVITTPGHIDEAKKAGADLVGNDDLAADIKAGKIEFDMLLATPDAMRIVGQLGQILGPRGLMPNPKDGTVSADIVTAIDNAKKGQVRYRVDKGGIVHCTIGKLDFANDDLKANLVALMAALKKAKPTTSKGVYFKKATLSTTMGPGLSLDMASLEF